MKYLEDIAVGEKAVLGSHLFTAEEIKAFAARFDPQAFHLDEEAARQSAFGGLCASGWHTVAIWMRLMIAHRRRESEARGARGEPVAQQGPSPGFRELKWLKPVYAGDTLTYTSEVLATRASASRRGWGLVTSLNTAVNQKGERVMSFIGNVFVERRPQ